MRLSIERLATIVPACINPVCVLVTVRWPPVAVCLFHPLKQASAAAAVVAVQMSNDID